MAHKVVTFEDKTKRMIRVNLKFGFLSILNLLFGCNNSELLIEIKQWRERRNIPDRVVLVDGDNELFIDMDHPLSIRAWLSIAKKRPSFRLEEFLFDSETAIVRGEEGVFMNEFIFAFYREIYESV